VAIDVAIPLLRIKAQINIDLSGHSQISIGNAFDRIDTRRVSIGSIIAEFSGDEGDGFGTQRIVFDVTKAWVGNAPRVGSDNKRGKEKYPEQSLWETQCHDGLLI
jgi:hypothetical protein